MKAEFSHSEYVNTIKIYAKNPSKVFRKLVPYVPTTSKNR